MSEENILEKGAILQRDKKTYAIVPRMPAGLLTTEYLDKITQAVKKFNIPLVKVVSGQRLALIGVKKDDIDKIWNFIGVEKGDAIGLCFHYVQACPGTDTCKFGVQDSTGLAVELEEKYYGIAMPAKFKLGISGCPYCCGESYVRDIGIVGKKSGWTLAIGGNAGANARIADTIGTKLTKEELLELLDKFIDYYKINANPKERSARFIKRLGIEKIKEELGIC